jgi:xanthine dehydrogenase molybdopterin-binding subunit B
MGGAYGGKISPPAAMAAAAALGAMNLNRPVRLVLDFRTNMELVGKRYPYLIKYNVSYKLLSVDAKFEDYIEIRSC